MRNKHWPNNLGDAVRAKRIASQPGGTTVSLGYTNQAGTPGRTATQSGLQAGDTGVRSLQSVTLSVPALDALVAEHEAVGAEHVPSPGIRLFMPHGYALMRNADHTHYYYIAEDGRESSIHWNKWTVWSWAWRAAHPKKE